MNAERNMILQQSDHFPPDTVAVELAVRFIEDDPGFSGADAIKVQLAAYIETAMLTPDQRNRLAAVLLRALRHGGVPLFRAYARLAPTVTSPLFEAAVTCYAASCQHPVAERAQHVLDILTARQRSTASTGEVNVHPRRMTDWNLCSTNGEAPADQTTLYEGGEILELVFRNDNPVNGGPASTASPSRRCTSDHGTHFSPLAPAMEKSRGESVTRP
jgi:hypothetical protein